MKYVITVLGPIVLVGVTTLVLVAILGPLMGRESVEAAIPLSVRENLYVDKGIVDVFHDDELGVTCWTF